MIDCSAIKTGGEWSYVLLEDPVACYDANPDPIKYKYSV